MNKLRWLVPVTLILGLVLIFPKLTNAEAKFELSDLKITPTFITAGSDNSSITISVKVTNTGDEAGLYTVELKIDGAIEVTKDVTLEPDDAETVVFNISKSEPGDYTVQIGNLEGEFSVAPEGLVIKNLTINPEKAKPGEEVIISVIVQNKSTEMPLIYDALKLKINGNVIDSEVIELDEGESETISFTVAREEVGDYVVQVGPKTRAFNVTASFWSTFPPYLWAVFGVVAGILVMLIIVVAFMAPRRRRARIAAKAQKDTKAPIPPGTAQPMTPRPPTGQPMPPRPPSAQPAQPQQAPQQPLPPRAAPQQPTPAQPVPPPPEPQQPAPVQPLPPRAAPQQPAPAQPVSPQPTPQQPTPAQSVPLQPAPQQPAPAQPVPPQPAPLQPAPAQPVTTQPALQQPAPIPLLSPQPGLQQPTPAQPVPPQPAPQQPAPAQPPVSERVTPSQPAPMQPTFVPQPKQPQAPVTPAPVPRGMPAKTSPQFSISRLTITPRQVKEGEPVTISALATNTGTATGQYSMVLRVGSVVENIYEMTLNPGGTQLATFTTVKDVAGEYHVEIDSHHGSFTVTPRRPAAFTVSNLSISPDRVNQGEPVTISAIVTNTGEAGGNYSVVLRIKGIAESIEEIGLAPGRSQQVVFSVVKEAAGFYPIQLENLSGRFVVEMDWKE